MLNIIWLDEGARWLGLENDAKQAGAAGKAAVA
jgi:hypothetical protein